jgi:hypothetical protein
VKKREEVIVTRQQDEEDESHQYRQRFGWKGNVDTRKNFSIK